MENNIIFIHFFRHLLPAPLSQRPVFAHPIWCAIIKRWVASNIVHNFISCSFIIIIFIFRSFIRFSFARTSAFSLLHNSHRIYTTRCDIYISPIDPVLIKRLTRRTRTRPIAIDLIWFNSNVLVPANAINAFRGRSGTLPLLLLLLFPCSMQFIFGSAEMWTSIINRNELWVRAIMRVCVWRFGVRLSYWHRLFYSIQSFSPPLHRSAFHSPLNRPWRGCRRCRRSSHNSKQKLDLNRHINKEKLMNPANCIQSNCNLIIYDFQIKWISHRNRMNEIDHTMMRIRRPSRSY